MLWNAKSKDATFQGIWRFSVDWHFTVDLQIGGCGKWQDSANLTIGVIDHMRECGVWEDRVSFHGQSANHMMRQFAWSGISREIGKWQDATISRHYWASRKCSSHTVSFSKFLSVRNYTIHNIWLVQNLNFKTATFQFFFSQSYQNQVMLQWRTCAQALRWTIDDISRCKCRIVS